MLTSITLKEYTTFIKETTFDFKATNYKILENTNVGTNRILKGALFIGENASGKTKVLDSIVLLLDILLENEEQVFIAMKSLYTKGEKFNISYKFNIENNELNYELEFYKNTINQEKLYLNNQIIIERLKENGNTYHEKDKKEVNNIEPTLSLVKQEYYNNRFNNNSILNKWIEYLKNSIYINCVKREIKGYYPGKSFEQTIYKYAEKNSPTKINEFLTKLGYNSEVDFHENNILDVEAFKKHKSIITLRKKGTKIALPLQFESSGNQAFMSIILPIIYATKNDGMIIIDEFSSGLHNELEESLIKYFFNNSKNSQMFFVTHSTNILDNFLIRPDQIYSLHFDSKEGTIVKRFSDENPRESQNLERMYLNGVFDGKPTYSKEFKD